MTAHSINARSVRTYLAGGGASTALVAGAVVAFMSVAAVVAFNGLPGDSAPDEGDSLFVGGPPAAAATAVGAAPGAVADDAAPLPPAATDALLAVAGPDGALPPGAPAPPGSSTGPDGTVVVPGQPGDGSVTTTSAPPGPIGGVVDGVDETTGNLGLDLNLGESTKPLTDPIDQTLEENLPGVSDAVGKLGQGVTDTANGLLGGGS